MKIQSSLNARTYLKALKEQMGSHTAFGAERFTGFFLGRLFCVTYHSGHEWNRRITNEKNCAVGVVRTADTGCQVSFLRFKGCLCPPQFLMLAVCCFVMSMAVCFAKTGSFELGFPAFGVCAVCLAVVAPVYTLAESFTERSEEGRKALLAALLDPTDPFSYLNHYNQL